MNDFESRKLAGLIENIDLRNKNGFASEHLFNEMAILSPNAINKLEAGLQWIKNHNIQAIIVGGTAVVHYVTGARSLTPDVDFLTNNLNFVIQCANNDGLAVERIYPDMSSTNGVQVKDFDADFLDANTGMKKLNKYALEHAVQGRIGGGTFSIIAPEILAIMKLEMGREKDIGDGFLLLQSGQVNKQAYLKAIEELGRSLKEVESMKLYAQMIK